MKKTRAILIVLVGTFLIVFAADQVFTLVDRSAPVPVSYIEKSVTKHTPDSEDVSGYINEEFGFSFMYNDKLRVTTEDAGFEDILLRVSITPVADFLSALTGLMTVEVSTTPLKLQGAKKAFLGTAEVKEYRYSVAGGEFIVFEKKLKDFEYIRIQLPREYYDMTFDPDIYTDEQMSEMVDVSMAFQDLINSFMFDVE
jgi:hypothetical protein